MNFFISETISEHIAQTEEGFLICKDVPIARTGQLVYCPGESPVEPGENGVSFVDRPEQEVFDRESMASFEGKPITINHPKEPVTPANCKELSVGHAQNIRRGDGEDCTLLLADFVITDERAIALIRGGLREISCGYDADYEQIKPGMGRQSRIRGNHIALVSRGRCGHRCRINDSNEENMKEKKFLDGLMAFFKTPEGAKVLDSLEDDKKEGSQEPPAKKEEKTKALELEAIVARINELEIQLRGLLESKTKDNEEETADDNSAAKDEQAADSEEKEEEKKEQTVDAATKIRATYLVPGIIVQDSDMSRSVKRAALKTAASKNQKIKAVVDGVLSGSTLDGCSCDKLDAAFIAASEIAKADNNGRTADAFLTSSIQDFGKVATPADINKLNANFYGKGV